MLEKAREEVLVNSLSMLCPFEPEEKQVLLEIFRKDKEWKDGYAKKQLLLIFDHLGSENELSKKGRRALTSMIFV